VWQQCAMGICWLDNMQDDHQPSIIEMKGMIHNHPISVMIDPSSNFNYISPKISEWCVFQSTTHDRLWLVQLATGTQKRVKHVVK